MGFTVSGEVRVSIGILAAITLAAAGAQARCPQDPLAAAVARTVAVPARGGIRVGTISYTGSAPLGDHEIALTFDDGPDDENTHAVLAILERHCIRATFFLVGQEADGDPDTVRAIAQAGHTIGSHTQTHPASLAALPQAEARAEITQGIDAIRTALAPLPEEVRRRQLRFFRYPGLIDSPDLNEWVAEQGYAVISADIDADDWEDLGSEDILARAILRTQARGRGVLLLHDFNPKMIAVLDRIIVALENRGFQFVQLVEAGAEGSAPAPRQAPAGAP
jgi:peptidoglycan-N-acetylglucosamine deacetylase